MRPYSDIDEGEVFRALDSTGADSKNFKTIQNGWKSKLDLPVEAARPGEGWVESVGSVCVGYDDRRIFAGIETIHQSQKLRYKSTGCFVGVSCSAFRNTVYLVKENDRLSRVRVFCVIEDFTEQILGLSPCHT